MSNVYTKNTRIISALTPTPISVTAGEAITREAPAYIQTTGGLEADEQSDIAPEVSARFISGPSTPS